MVYGIRRYTLRNVSNVSNLAHFSESHKPWPERTEGWKDENEGKEEGGKKPGIDIHSMYIYIYIHIYIYTYILLLSLSLHFS